MDICNRKLRKALDIHGDPSATPLSLVQALP